MSDFCTKFNSAFARCVINTLLNMAVAALEALKAFLQAQVVFLDVIIAQLMMQLMQYDVLGMIVKKEADAVRAFVDQMISMLNGLPLGLIDPACLEWAGIMDGINDYIQNEIKPPLDQILTELERLSSFQDELQALKNEYEALKQLFFDLIDLIEAVILEAKCRKAKSAGNQFVM
jgi:hypothetical protein